MKRTENYIALIIFLLILSGCMQQTTIPAIDTTATRGLISSSTSQISVAKFSLTPSNKKPTLYPGQIATMEAKATQTIQALNENCDGYSSVEYRMSDPQSLVSPDGKWSVAYCLDSVSQLPYTKLMQTGTEKSWRIPFYETFGASHRDVKDGFLRAEYWSNDGQYVYLDAYFCCLDGPGMRFVNTYGLYRVDLRNGRVEESFPGASAFAFSPDGQYLAANDHLNNAIHIYDLTHNLDTVFPVDQKYLQTGMFAWSPNSDRVIFVGALPDWEATLFTSYAIPTITPQPGQDGFSLLMVDMETHSYVTLIDNDLHLFSLDTWINNNEVLLIDMNGNYYTLNIETNELLITSTPTLNP